MTKTEQLIKVLIQTQEVCLQEEHEILRLGNREVFIKNLKEILETYKSEKK